MNIADMHIAVNLGVQKVASFQVDTLLTEEIDFELNKSIERFVSQRYNKLGNKYGTGVEESQKRIDDLRTLIAEYSAHTTHKGQISDKHFIDSFQLPGEGILSGPDLLPGLVQYRHLLNARSLVFYDKCNKIETIETDGYTGVLDEVTLDIASGGSNYYSTPIVTFASPSAGGVTATGVCTIDGGGTLTNITLTNPGSGYTPADFPLQIDISAPSPPTLFTENCLYTPGDPTAQVFDSFFNMGNLSLGYGVRAGAVPNPPSLSWPAGEVFITSIGSPASHNFDMNVANIGVSNQLLGTFEFTDYSAIITPAVAAVSGLTATTEAGGITIEMTDGTQNTRTIDAEDFQSTSVVNKYIQLDDIYTMLDDPFNTTKYTKPLMTIRDNFLDIYTDDTFLVNKVKITYIRKPVTVVHANSALATIGAVNCDLPQHTHQEIVELTVNSILEGFSDPRYKTHFGSQLMNSE